MALDQAGFKRKRFDDIFSEMEIRAKEVFGQTINTSERSVMGIILRIFAWFIAKAWQNSEDVYNSGYVNTAVGGSLDKLGPHGGITRIQAKQATGQLRITGTAAAIVNAGFRAASGSIVFETIEAITLGSDGTGIAPIRAVEPGRSGNVSAGSIVTIVNPTASVSAVTNLSETLGGREKETDQEFRGRFAISTEGRGKATVGSLRAALLSVPGVRAAAVVENYSSVEVDGRPSKSFQAYVLGGVDAAIGQAILDTKAAGIEPFGDVSATALDEGGFQHTMYFSRAQEIAVQIRFSIKRDSTYPVDGDVQIRTAAVRYIGGEDYDGTVYVGLNMGDDVVYSRLYALAFSVGGVTDVLAEISVDDGDTWLQENVTIAPNSVAQITYTAVQVIYI